MWRVLVESSWGLGDPILRLEEPNLWGDDVRDLRPVPMPSTSPAGKHDGIYGRAPTRHAALPAHLGISDDRRVGLEKLRRFSAYGW